MLLGFLLVLLVMVCIALGGVILLQRSEGGALGMGGGPSGFMTARGAGDLLTRTTSILAGVFFILCLLLTVLSGRSHGSGSVVDRLKVQGLNPDALGAIKHTSAPEPATPPPAAGGGAANIGVVTPPSGSAFEAPRPEVHTAPAVQPTTNPPTAADTGANRPSSTTLGVQAAPQSSATFAPLARPFPAAGSASPTAKPAPTPPSVAPSGNPKGGA